MKVRFMMANGKVEPVTETGEPIDDDIHVLFSAHAVLWEGSICSETQLAADLSDPPHMFALRASKARGMVAEDVAAAKRLTEVARAYRLAPEGEAGAAVLSAAVGLKRERDYLHHGLGWAPDGLVVVIAHGMLEELGMLAARAGATHLLVVENGGSPYLGLRSAGGLLRTLVSSYYYRPEAIAMLMIELSPDDVVFDGRSDPARMGVRGAECAREKT